jgi:hypothetical protein
MAENEKPNKPNYLDKKIRAAKNPDSIFLHGYWAYKLGKADQMVSDIRRRFSFDSTSDESLKVKVFLNELQQLSDSMWNFAYKLSPKLAASDFSPMRWREINDSPEMKLIYARRKVIAVIVPRHDEIGRLAMAVKIIGERMLEKKQTAPYEELEALSSEYAVITKKFADFMFGVARQIDDGDDVRKRTNIKVAADAAVSAGA